MAVTLISKRYAQALYNLALEMDRLERINSDVKLVREVIAENPKFRRLLKSPIIQEGKKSSILKSIFSRHLDELTMRFLLLVTRKEREVFLEEISEAFLDLYKEHHNIVTVKVTTVAAFDEKTRKDLLEMLRRDLNHNIELVEHIDPEMIGGFIITLDDKKYDASIRRQLEKLNKSFETNPYVRGF
jgi:F-type H+-transporting ATPase subunit delta